MQNRRAAVAMMMSFLASLQSLSATASDALTQVLLVIGNPANSTIDEVGRAFAVALRQASPQMRVDVRNDGAASGRVALAECIKAVGQADRLFMLPGGILYTAFGSEADFSGDLDAVSILGSIGVDRRALFVTARTGITTFEELVSTKRLLVAPATTAAASGFIEAKLINAITGTQLQPVGGYSSAERKLALLSGEAEAVVGSLDTFQDLVDEGALRPLLRLNEAGPQAPSADLPLLRSAANAPEMALLVDLIEATANANSLFVAPPELSGDHLERLQALFDRAASALQADPPPQLGAALVQSNGGEQTRSRILPVLAKRDLLHDAFSRALG